MSAWPPPVHGPGPVHVRWPRRIAGLLATAALFGVAIAMATMIVPDGDEGAEIGVPRAPAAAKPHEKAAAHKPKRPALTAAQRKARATAVASLRSQGYEPVRIKDFDPRHALRVLVGYRSGDPQGPRRAFFFRSSGLVGTDSTAPSSALKVTGSGKSWATLSYGIYATGDEACCPSGGRRKVRFAWTGSALAPVGGTIPASWQRVAQG